MVTFKKPNHHFMLKSLLLTLLGCSLCCASQPIIDMLERIGKGASAHFIIETRVADKDNYEHDLVDILRQPLTERGRLSYSKLQEAYKMKDKARLDMTCMRCLSSSPRASLRMPQSQSSITTSRLPAS